MKTELPISAIEIIRFQGLISPLRDSLRVEKEATIVA